MSGPDIHRATLGKSPQSFVKPEQWQTDQLIVSTGQLQLYCCKLFKIESRELMDYRSFHSSTTSPWCLLVQTEKVLMWFDFPYDVHNSDSTGMAWDPATKKSTLHQ